jgi:hypothetical protein
VAKPKKNSKKAKAALRASKRRRILEAVEDEPEAAEESAAADDQANGDKEDDTFGGMKWECLAVTLDELNAFIASIDKSRDLNERALRKRIVDDLLPLLEKQEEARKRKAAQKERELLNLEKLATAKRSSRIAGKLEHQKQEEEAREAERKREAELTMAKKEQEKWLKLEKERESRMLTREQRLKEREARRILHEEELANLSEDNKKLESGQGRLSERHLKAEIERKKQALEDLADEDDWIFDCICGAYGQYDDGTHSIACEKCNIWQHSKCVGVSQEDAERDDFHFICKTCERRAKDAERAKTHPPIKIKLNRPGSSSSMAPQQSDAQSVSVQPIAKESRDLHSSPHGTFNNLVQTLVEPPRFAPSNGPQVALWQSPYAPPSIAVAPQYNGQRAPSKPAEPAILSTSVPSANAMAYDRPSSNAPRPFSPYASNASPLPSGVSKSPSVHAFSSPHPYSPTNLPPPVQHQSYSFVNGNAVNYGRDTLNAARPQGGPVQDNVTGYPPMQASPSPAAPQGQGASTPSRVIGIQPPATNDVFNRRNSVNVTYPPSSTPALTPISKAYPAGSFSSSNPLINATPSAQTAGILPPQSASSFRANGPHYEQIRALDHSSPLPPVATGLSPTKHSPPRSMASNGSLASVTPSVLPPVALSPSPQHQNLTPPVKSSEPERRRENGQIMGS